MSGNDKGTSPDYEPEFSTVNLIDLKPECSTVLGNLEDRPKPSDKEDVEQEKYIKPIEPSNDCKPKKNRRTSLIWTKFTIVNKKDQIAACNICDRRMSIRSTSNNLKKHLERKHGYSIKSGVLPKRANQPKYITPTPKPKVSELAGISDQGITLKVVGENGEEEHFQVIGEQFLSEEAVQGEVQEHDYSTPHTQAEARDREIHPPRLHPQHKAPTFFLDEKSKKQRIMDLQLECLENKKYNMQLEALLMEQRLNLPRSIFTEPLHYKDSQTRSTQTEVGGSDTKVFYITDKRGGTPVQQLFAFQDLDH